MKKLILYALSMLFLSTSLINGFCFYNFSDVPEIYVYGFKDQKGSDDVIQANGWTTKITSAAQTATSGIEHPVAQGISASLPVLGDAIAGIVSAANVKWYATLSNPNAATYTEAQSSCWNVDDIKKELGDVKKLYFVVTDTNNKIYWKGYLAIDRAHVFRNADEKGMYTVAGQ